MKRTIIKVLAPIAILVAGALIAGGMVSATADDGEAKPDTPPAPLVTVAKVTPERFQVNIAAWGELRPKEQTQLSSFVSGEIIDIHDNFLQGGLVQKGEVLVVIDESDYRAALIEAKSNLAAAQANLEQELAQAEVAKEEWATVSQDKVTALALRKPQVLSARSQLQAAEAALTRAKRNLERCKVRAPYDALVVSRNIGLGQVINQGNSIGEVYNVESAEVMLPIAGFDMPFLPHNIETLTASLSIVDQTGVSLNLGDNVQRDVRIDRDLGIVDSRTRMSNLVAVLDDPYGLRTPVTQIKFGSYVKVTVPGRMLENVVTVSQDAVTNRKVWLVDSENKLVERTVTILRQEGEQVLISEGLVPGELVVTSAPDFPQNGMLVEVAKPSELEVNAVAFKTTQVN